ncbi:MAG: Holliday junction resolvase RuvX [Ectothiorhodospiraceae bacterium]|nr:Holliday junction resolvase RuvX [Ectothiorhodospiraceae bacterium]
MTPGVQRVLGFDYGLRRIGVAVGETVTGTARALVTLDCPHPGQPDWEAIGSLVARWQPQALIVGLPLLDDGGEGDMARAAQRFARRLRGRHGLPVHLVEERLSSREARERLDTLPARARRDKGAIDMIAASIILETWLRENGR